MFRHLPSPESASRRRVLLVAGAATCLGLAVPAAAQDAPSSAAESVDEAEEIVVQATRSGRRVKDEPIRVEVIDQEEVEEKMAMVPGNVSMVVAETGGLRV